MEDKIEGADYVLLVCTELYLKKVRQDAWLLESSHQALRLRSNVSVRASRRAARYRSCVPNPAPIADGDPCPRDTSAAAGINPEFTPGSLVLLSDQINLLGSNPM
jgi:hypothetical protein